VHPTFNPAVKTQRQRPTTFKDDKQALFGKIFGSNNKEHNKK
jgi:hypothetical protein